MPDSITSRNVWVHAVTHDLKAGSIHREARTGKDLMVRTYLPRFLREGDQAELKVVLNNMSKGTLKGTLSAEITDPETGENPNALFGLTGAVSSTKAFAVAAGCGSNVTFPIAAPARVGSVAFRVTAVSGDFCDAELRALPVLPGRMHLAQSRFVTLKGNDRRETRFETWDSVDPNREMGLEETPWLQEAKGGDDTDLLKVLEPQRLELPAPS